MRIAWDCRSIAPHMGGIGHAALGWMTAFSRIMPPNWQLLCLFSTLCDEKYVRSILPNTTEQIEIFAFDAGFIDPQFEQLFLPTFLKTKGADLYFNPAFTVPAIKTTKFQASVIHDVVFIEHPEWVEPGLRKYLEHGTDLSMSRADNVFTVSQFSKNRIKSVSQGRYWLNTDRISIISPAVDDQLRTVARCNKPRTTSIDYLLYLGAMERKKGIDGLLDAYMQVRQRMGVVCPRLCLAGGIGGQQYDLQAAIESRKLRDFVDCLGCISEIEKYELLRHAKLFLFPSFYEGFGIPPLEAMTFGIPVIAARTSALPEVLEDAAVWVDPADPCDFAKKIVELLASPLSCRQKIECGTKQAAKFQWDHAANTLLDCFKLRASI